MMHTLLLVQKRILPLIWIYSHVVDKLNGLKCDQIIRLKNFYAATEYPMHLRRIKYYDAESSRTLVFLTTNFEIEAQQVATLYKSRWQIELFFKWIKQH